MTTTDQPTQPLRIVVSRAAMRSLRQQGTQDRQRADDLRRAENFSAYTRDRMIPILARMSARPETEQLRREYVAIQRAIAMKYHGISSATIRDEQRRR